MAASAAAQETPRRKFYRNASEKPDGAEPKREDNQHMDVNGMLGRQKSEREALRVSHEAARRDTHNRQRDEHRSMDARHETEHEGVSEPNALTALHRTHEHEKHRLRMHHAQQHEDLAARHHEERHDMHVRHEAEMREGGAA